MLAADVAIDRSYHGGYNASTTATVMQVSIDESNKQVQITVEIWYVDSSHKGKLVTTNIKVMQPTGGAPMVDINGTEIVEGAQIAIVYRSNDPSKAKLRPEGWRLPPVNGFRRATGLFGLLGIVLGVVLAHLYHKRKKTQAIQRS